MPTTEMVHVRIDVDIKAQAAEVLNEMGLSISDAVRVFLEWVVVEKRLPLELKVPNATTRRAMAEADEIIKSGKARFHSAEELFEALEKAAQ